MKAWLRALITGFLALVLTSPAAFAQHRPAFSQQELDQMLAPIALYPDALLSQILMAATYPVEVVQAARWSRANAHITGEDAVRAVEPMDWDPSVESLVAFPQILNRMDEKLDWTERLGEAFIAQELQVMDTIQHLRRRAAAAGHLGPSEQMRVVRQGDYILIEPASPQVVYVPYYNPAVVYGPWWWPAYPPVYWAPWPGYAVPTAYAPAYLWGSGIVIRIGFFFGHFDWPHRHVTVVHRHPPKVVEDHRATVMHRPSIAPDPKPARWQHDPRRRRNAPYRFTEPREPRAAHPATMRDDRRPDETGHSTRSQPRHTPQPPVRALPAAPRTDARPAPAARESEDRQPRRPVPAPTPAARTPDNRGNVERPPTIVHAERPVAQPFASHGSPAPRAGNGPQRAGIRQGGNGGVWLRQSSEAPRVRPLRSDSAR